MLMKLPVVNDNFLSAKYYKHKLVSTEVLCKPLLYEKKLDVKPKILVVLTPRGNHMKSNLSLKKTKIVLNFFTVRYFNLG